MSNMVKFRTERDSIKTFDGLKKWIEANLNGYSFSASWTNGAGPESLGHMNGFINPPREYTGVNPIFVIGDSENDYVERVKKQLPRMLIEIENIQEYEEAEKAEQIHGNKVASKPRGRIGVGGNGGAPRGAYQNAASRRTGDHVRKEKEQ